MLPLAHLGHWLWVFYVIPVLIVVAGILWSSYTAKRRESADGDPAAALAESAEGEAAPAAGGTVREAENGDPVPARRPPSP